MIRRTNIFTVLLLAFVLISSCAYAKTQPMTLDGDHGKLSAILQTPDGKTQYPAVILCHGFISQKEYSLLKYIADDLEAEGIASIRFDFNGHGESEGAFQDMTVLNEIEDAKKVYAYMSSLPEVTSIAIAGHSQGGVVSSMVAGELGDSIKAVMLLAPAAVLRDDAIRGSVFDSRFDSVNLPEYVEVLGDHKVGRNYFATAQTLPIYETASKYKGPACLIHGKTDVVVPYTYSLHYREIWPESKLTLIENCDHGFTGHQEEAAKIAAEFFAKTLKD